MNQYQDVKKLERDIRRFYVENDEDPVFNKEEEKTYREFLNNCIKEALKIENIGYKQKDGFDHFINTSVDIKDKAKGRYPLNMSPDVIIDAKLNVILRMIRGIATLPYVYDVKVQSYKFYAKKRLDNVVVYFCDSENNGNKHKLEQGLRPYGEYTRPGHPAMLQSIEGIKGMAYADQSEKSSFSDKHTGHIADVRWELRGEKITFEEFQSRVKGRYRENGIDPDEPYRYLPKERETQYGEEG